MHNSTGRGERFLRGLNFPTKSGGSRNLGWVIPPAPARFSDSSLFSQENLSSLQSPPSPLLRTLSAKV